MLRCPGKPFLAFRRCPYASKTLFGVSPRVLFHLAFLIFFRSPESCYSPSCLLRRRQRVPVRMADGGLHSILPFPANSQSAGFARYLPNQSPNK